PVGAKPEDHWVSGAGAFWAVCPKRGALWFAPPRTAGSRPKTTLWRAMRLLTWGRRSATDAVGRLRTDPLIVPSVPEIPLDARSARGGAHGGPGSACGGERLVEVVEQIGHVLDAHAQAQQSVGDPRRPTRLLGHGLVRHR